jgi:hypothetical protein
VATLSARNDLRSAEPPFSNNELADRFYFSSFSSLLIVVVVIIIIIISFIFHPYFPRPDLLRT